jgi:hypothetical protein
VLGNVGISKGEIASKQAKKAVFANRRSFFSLIAGSEKAVIL